MPTRLSNAPAGWLWLSTVEDDIVREANADAWLTAEKIASALGRDLSTEFRAVLKTPAERKILVSAQSRGYKLNADESQPRR